MKYYLLSKRINLIVLLILLIAVVDAGAQATKELLITGKVTDENSMPLPGVQIKLKNTKLATVTNPEGGYQIKVPAAGDVLVFSYVGYTTKEIKTTTAGAVNLSLTPSKNGLNEVVIVGYGTVKRSDLTGSIGSVDVKDLQKAPVASFEDALAGRVAGVAVTTSDGQPGDKPTITIRGNNSVTQDNSPLYVVDGFPIEDFSANTINPSEIESIEILKDASATAIYGSRAANGVILLNTKRGKAGPPNISLQTWVGLSENIRQIELMNPYEFVKYQQELNPSFGAIYLTNNRDLDYYQNVKGIDWQDLVFKSAYSTSNSVSISGGTDKTKYAISGSVFSQDGTVINSGFDRYQGRMVLDQSINTALKVGVNLNYSKTKTSGQILRNSENSSATSYTMYSVWGSRPVSGNSDVDLTDELTDPELGTIVDYRINPVINLNNILNNRYATTLNANGYLEYKFLKNFTFKTTAGFNNSANSNESFYNSRTSNGSNQTAVGASNGPNGSLSSINNNNWLNENTLTFNKTYGENHSVNVLSGFTMQGANFRSFGYQATQIPNELLGPIGLEEGILKSATSTESANTLASFLARANYGYKSKYLLTLTFRSDGSSKFAENNKWSYFPSASAAWVISKEKFMKDFTFISNAKFRIGYGTIGNNRVSDFGYLSQILLNFTSGAGNTRTGYNFNNAYNNGAAPFNLGNANLKWETTGSFNTALDVSLFKERISLTTEFYVKNTYDLLLNATLAPSMGYRRALKNIGKVSNRGFEFTINTINVDTKNFNWSSSFNIAFNKNKVVALNENEPSLTTGLGWNANFAQEHPYIAKPGRPIALFYGYIHDGVYQLSDFNSAPNGTYMLKNSIPATGVPKPGYIKYKDINNDGLINALDRTIIGNPNPLHTGGFTNNFKYKNIDLNVFMQWSYGNDVLNANRIDFEGQTSRGQLNMFATYADRWSFDNQTSQNYIAGGGGPTAYSDRLVEDGSFIRLKTVSLGYNIPYNFLKKYKVKGFRAYVSAQNLFTLTNYSGLDPEVSTSPSALTPGFDYSPYPKPRVTTFGINVVF